MEKKVSTDNITSQDYLDMFGVPPMEESVTNKQSKEEEDGKKSE